LRVVGAKTFEKAYAREKSAIGKLAEQELLKERGVRSHKVNSERMGVAQVQEV